ncbi:MAG: Glu-tRNA(Gln) amidotransferase subunit GatD [Nanoarchaeota archaeon]
MEPEFGDNVLVYANDNTYEGVLMPRPSLLDKNIVVIKLNNGYNIGIDKKNIKKIELKSKYKPKVEKPKKIEFKKNLPTISVLSFGGTISSKVDYKTGGTYADYTAEDFVMMCPELSDIANIKAKKVMGKMSEDFTPKDWTIMAREIEKEIKTGVDGIIISQGTDTLHFSTSAIHYMFERLNIPIIFTASQRSIDRGSSDAFMNLICSVNATSKFKHPGVFSCMHGTTNDDYCILIKGNKLRKMHTSRRDAFRPINDSIIAKVYTNGVIDILDENYKENVENNNFKKSEVSLKPVFEEKTALIYVYPGFNPKIFDFYIENNYKGIVIAATALGHVCSSGKNNVLPYIKKAIENGILVVISSQTIYGKTHKYVYSTLRKLSVELNCVFSEDLTPETSYVKLGVILSKAKNKDEATKLFLMQDKDERSLADSFLN